MGGRLYTWGYNFHGQLGHGEQGGGAEFADNDGVQMDARHALSPFASVNAIYLHLFASINAIAACPVAAQHCQAWVVCVVTFLGELGGVQTLATSIVKPRASRLKPCEDSWNRDGNGEESVLCACADSMTQSSNASRDILDALPVSHAPAMHLRLRAKFRVCGGSTDG